MKYGNKMKRKENMERRKEENEKKAGRKTEKDKEVEYKNHGQEKL